MNYHPRRRCVKFYIVRINQLRTNTVHERHSVYANSFTYAIIVLRDMCTRENPGLLVICQEHYGVKSRRQIQRAAFIVNGESFTPSESVKHLTRACAYRVPVLWKLCAIRPKSIRILNNTRV